MKVGTKLFLWLAAPIVSLILLFGYVDGRVSRERLREELAREGRAITRAVQLAVEDALRDRQLEDVKDFIDSISGFERVFGIRLFDQEGKIRYQSQALVQYEFTRPEALQQVLRTRETFEARRHYGEDPAVTFIAPLEGPGQTLLGAVQVIQLESYIDEDLRVSRNTIAALTAAMILATAIVLSLVTRFVVNRPIDRLVDSCREVGAGRRPPAVLASSDELGRLALEFSAMYDRLEAAKTSLMAEQAERERMEASLRNTARLASLGQLAAGLAHEIGTPLGVIGGRAESLQRRLAGNGHAEQSLGIVLDQIDRISRIVRSMLDFAKVRELHLTETDLGQVLESTIEFVDHRFEELGIEVQSRIDPRARPVRADGENLQEVFLNLTMNAADAMPEGGHLFVCIRPQRRAHPDQGTDLDLMEVEFMDDGVGIAPEHIDRVFDPFFTTKDIGKGTGLGLSVSYGIVREHGGWMEVESAPSRGTTMRVLLPVAGPPENGGST